MGLPNTKSAVIATVLACLFAFTPAPDASAAEREDDPVYVPEYEYPILEAIKDDRDERQAERDSLQGLVDARYAEQQRAADDTKRELRIDWSDVDVPTGPEAFEQIWHTPPVAQYYTGSCWAFCSVSFLESEANRLQDVQCKLSEMWVVYWEYVEKARRYLREYGHSLVAQGGQDHGTLEVFKLYGAVPAAAYPGVLNRNGWHDHAPLMKELKGYLEWVRETKTWDESQNLLVVRSILDKHLGRPPETVEWDGATYDPRAFLAEVLRLELDDYVSCVSRLDEPFHTWVLLDVPDNWRRKTDYYNLPLVEFYRVIKDAVQDGYSVVIGGDVSEPGRDGKQDAAIIPSWDIPSEHINQASRELRIVNGTTTDDHGVHVVGFTRYGGRDWFLIKDSNRSSRLGRFEGIYFFDGDFIKLKMLGFLVHKDRMQGLLP